MYITHLIKLVQFSVKNSPPQERKRKIDAHTQMIKEWSIGACHIILLAHQVVLTLNTFK